MSLPSEPPDLSERMRPKNLSGFEVHAYPSYQHFQEALNHMEKVDNVAYVKSGTFYNTSQHYVWQGDQLAPYQSEYRITTLTCRRNGLSATQRREAAEQESSGDAPLPAGLEDTTGLNDPDADQANDNENEAATMEQTLKAQEQATAFWKSRGFGSSEQRVRLRLTLAFA
jgi:hypothetical protein